MDAMTLHLLTKLDDMRETQLQHGQLITKTAQGVAALTAASSPPRTSPASFAQIAASAAQWAGALLAAAFLAGGGDAGTAMAFLQKLF